MENDHSFGQTNAAGVVDIYASSRIIKEGRKGSPGKTATNN
jgi:hypothetical protein